MRSIWFILIAFLIFSCGRSNTESSLKKVFRYNEASGLTSLDPAFAKDQSIIWPCLEIYNGLVQLDTGLRIIPCIAHSWEISDSGKTYIFHGKAGIAAFVLLLVKFPHDHADIGLAWVCLLYVCDAEFLVECVSARATGSDSFSFLRVFF